MSELVTGHCLCGDVQFAVPSEPMFQILCHCTDCQTVSGSPFYTAYIVMTEQVELQTGETNGYEVLSDQGRKNNRRFCPKCGSRLWAELESGLASVNGMALDDKSHFNPTHNHRLETAPDWCSVIETIERELPNR